MPNKNGLILITPTSVDKTGTGSTATVSANGSVSFDNCATLSLNGVFSADYDNYRIVAWMEVNGSTTDDLWFRLRLSGTDNSTASSYVREQMYADSTSVGVARITTTQFYLAQFGTDPSGMVADVYGPYLAQPTAIRSTTVYSISSNPTLWDMAGTHNQSTAYDGFSIFPSTTTSRPAKGRVAVYGMRK
jgi:hypothetical protein